MKAGRRFHLEHRPRDQDLSRSPPRFPPFPRNAKDGAPSVLLAPAKIRAWATCRDGSHGLASLAKQAFPPPPRINHYKENGGNDKSCVLCCPMSMRNDQNCDDKDNSLHHFESVHHLQKTVHCSLPSRIFQTRSPSHRLHSGQALRVVCEGREPEMSSLVGRVFPG